MILALNLDVAVCGVGRHDTVTAIEKNGAERGCKVVSKAEYCCGHN